MLDPNKNEPDYLRSPAPVADGDDFGGPGRPMDTFDDEYIDYDQTAEHSLTDDIASLYEDGKTYLESELTYQKTRAKFVADQGKQAAVLGVGALALLHLALVGLTIGLIIGLAPFITIWGSTALVVGLLVVGAAILGSKLKSHVSKIGNAFGGDDA